MGLTQALAYAPYRTDIPGEVYHASLALSKSQLSKFSQAPRLYQWHFLEGNPVKETEDMLIGTVAHLLALEPENFKNRYYILPGGVRRDKRTDAFKDHIREAAGRPILRTEDLEKAGGVAAALLKDPAASLLLQSVEGQRGYAEHKIEQSYFWNDPETGLDLRCRPDDERSDGVIVDLKITTSAEPEAFARNAFNFNYDLSVAQTCAGFEAVHGHPPAEYCLIAAEKTAPHLISCFTTMQAFGDNGESVWSVGHHRWRNLLRRFKECKDAGRWPGYTREVTPLSIPKWELRKIEENEDGE